MRLSSPSFADGASIPERHAGAGEDISPALVFADIPERAVELALTCVDPDAKNWVHWLVYSVPTTLKGIPEGIPRSQYFSGGAQGLNSWGALGWGGPFPPRGEQHRYRFTLYALSGKLSSRPGIDWSALVKAIRGRVIAEASLISVFRR